MSTITLTHRKRIVLKRAIPYTPVLDIPKKTSRKSVRFNDDHLEQVVYFYKTMPPKSLNDQSMVSAQEYTLARPNWPSRTRVLYNDKDNMIRMEQVQLTDADYDQSKDFLLEGRCRALNVSYQKEVTIRYTFDLWSTYQETIGVFKESIPSTSNTWDRFSFSIPIQPKSSAQTIYLALKYSVNNQDYWDNNNGSNYQLILTPPEKVDVATPKPSLSKRYNFTASLSASYSPPPSPPTTPPIDHSYTSPIFIQDQLPARPEMSYTEFVNKYCFYNSHSNLIYSTSPSAVFT